MIKILFIVLCAIIGAILGVCIRNERHPDGLLHIDEYQDKDVYRMLYFVPIEDLKIRRKLRLKVEVQKWSGLSEGNDEIFD